MTESSTANLNGTLLIVDSSSEDRKSLAALLFNSTALHIVEARSAADALEALAKQPADAVITEIRMPVQDGLSLVREVHTHPRYARIPFMLTSATPPRDLKDILRSQGIAGFLAKPVDPAALLKLLTKLFAPAARPSLAEISVLVADHLPSARKVVMRMLDGLGIKSVAQAPNGREALTLCESQKFDVIIADREMPDLDGLSLIAEIRKQPKLQSVGFVLVSTQPLHGADDPLSPIAQVPFLKKPFDAKSLEKKLAEALERRGS